MPDKRYDKSLFRRKLRDIGVRDEAVDLVLDVLPTLDFGAARRGDRRGARVNAQEARVRGNRSSTSAGLAIRTISWSFRAKPRLRRWSFFPRPANESHGIEDLRMVRSRGRRRHGDLYGTCSAYDGCCVLPQLIETRDFLRVGVHTINGALRLNKGMALFPRRIGGHYAMCSRIDGEKPLHHVFRHRPFLGDGRVAASAAGTWEFVQIGNCGSPLETPEVGCS